MFEGVDHVVIAVEDLEKAVSQYETLFDVEVGSRGEPPGETYRNAMFRFPETMVELISPKSEEGPVARRLGIAGEGVYLMAMRVDDLSATVAKLREQGVRLIGDPGEGNPITGQLFVHPAESAGVLVQLVEDRKSVV